MPETNIVWPIARSTPHMPSPVLVDGLIFMLSDGGLGSCLEAATGEELWQERIGGEYAASMLYADGRVGVWEGAHSADQDVTVPDRGKAC